MTEQHLIALDLDGTLLKEDKTISSYSKAVIQKAKEAGHKIMISTGRPYRSSVMYYQELGLDTPIVNFNGAFIHHPLDDTWGRFHSPMNLHVAKEIVDAVYSFSFHNIIAEVVDDVYIHYHDPKLIEIFGMGTTQITTGDLRQQLVNPPSSMFIHTDEKHIKTIREHLSEVHAEMVSHRNWNAPWHVVEIVKSGQNKAIGVKKVADYYGIPRERIIAFGDEDNDLEMLDYAGKGIAMKNAIEPLKTVASDVTLTNEEDGVAIYLQEYLNLK